tara:strand:+ start:745 stop:942 length:198 start_codon:yes stop_codon:yes gene_type:complete
MLEYTPVHLAYPSPFIEKAEVVQKEDVSADRADDVVEFNFRIDLSHLMILNLVFNIIVLFVVLRK